MIRVRQIKVVIEKDNSDELLKNILRKLKINKEDIKTYEINKKSIDARKKEKINFVYEVDLEVINEEDILKQNNSDVIKIEKRNYEYVPTGQKKLSERPVIIGSGPAGLFAAYMMSLNGYNPIIIERGKDIERRIIDVNNFWETGKLNPNSNVQFGEGGAGTFSDGKLNTMVKDKNNRIKKVLEVFHENGATEEILYLHNPHIGTNNLVNIVKNMRNKIIENGGTFLFDSCLTNINIEDGKVKSIVINGKDTILTEVLILAIGHSARDTFKMLHSCGLYLENKPFAVGLRIMHEQELINKNQYGHFYNKLKPASYKLIIILIEVFIHFACVLVVMWLIRAVKKTN